jgi:hypothetical protein
MSIAVFAISPLFSASPRSQRESFSFLSEKNGMFLKHASKSVCLVVLSLPK